MFMFKCRCESVSVQVYVSKCQCSSASVEVSVCECECRSVSAQEIFRKNPSQCFREIDPSKRNTKIHAGGQLEGPMVRDLQSHYGTSVIFILLLSWLSSLLLSRERSTRSTPSMYRESWQANGLVSPYFTSPAPNAGAVPHVRGA